MPTMMKYLLDTSAILSGKDLRIEGDTYTTESVIDEFKPGGKSYRKLEYLLSAGLHVYSPSNESLEKVKTAASHTGDAKRLSEADRSVIALAIDLKAVILTDDYSIQNLARHLGIEFRGVSMKGIENEIRWRYRCAGCRKYYDEPLDECPICGASIKSKK